MPHPSRYHLPNKTICDSCSHKFAETRDTHCVHLMTTEAAIKHGFCTPKVACVNCRWYRPYVPEGGVILANTHPHVTIDTPGFCMYDPPTPGRGRPTTQGSAICSKFEIHEEIKQA